MIGFDGGDSSEEVDVDVVDRVCFLGFWRDRGESSEEEVDEDKYESFLEKLQKVWDKVKNYRKSGLESEGGELSLGNLVFKLLRRNGYIEKIMKLKKKSYDKQFK